MIWFTADHHLGHSNIIKYTNRPFKDVDEMDNILIDNWNKEVKELDTVYHLGDVTMYNYEKFCTYISRLRGNIKIVPGNHDYWTDNWDRYNNFLEPKSSSGIGIDVLPPLYTLKIGKKNPIVIVLCHYPLAIWDRSHFNSYHLHGHSHGKFKSVGKMYDVGVDSNNFKPVNLDEILLIMKDSPNNINYIEDRDNE
jgi:calcineurin-like phosphoesterase family protein